MDRALPQQSVWIAVDLETGALVVATPPSSTLRRIGLRPQTIRAGAAGPSDLLEDTLRSLQVLLVRPKTGAWGGTVGDGGASASDGQADGRIRLSLDQLTPFDDSPEIERTRIQSGDVVAAIVLDSLETHAVQIPGGPRP